MLFTARAVPDLLRARLALGEDDVVALRQADGTALAVAEWDTAARVLAGRLIARGVRPRDRVALQFTNADIIGYAIAYVATHLAGATCVSVQEGATTEQVRNILAATGPRLVVAASAVPGFETVTPAELHRTDVPEHVALPQCTGRDDIAEILTSSGSFGPPKAIAVTHGSLLADQDTVELRRIQPVRMVHGMPLGTNVASELLRSAMRGSSECVVVPRFAAAELTAALVRWEPSAVTLVPTMAWQLAQLAGEARFESVTEVFSTGARLLPRTAERLLRVFPGAHLTNVYGLTEGGTRISLSSRFDPAKPLALGRPSPPTTARIVDEHGTDAPPGTPGELWLTHPRLGQRHYLTEFAHSNTRFRDGWLQTGDIAYFDHDGVVHLLDRREDQLKVGGRLVCTAEIEEAVLRHPEVLDSAVVGLPHPALGTVPAAMVCTRHPVSRDELTRFLSGLLPPHMVPVEIATVETIPKTPSGKPMRRAIREHIERQPPSGRSEDGRIPEQRVAGLVASLIPSAGRRWDANLVALGATSLILLELADRIELEFGVSLPSADFFEALTVEGITRLLNARVAGEGSP